MPIYLYKCLKCNERWEDHLSVSQIDEPLSQECVYCGVKHNIVRVPTMANLAAAEMNEKAKMDPIVRQRLEKIKNRADIEPSTSKIDF